MTWRREEGQEVKMVGSIKGKKHPRHIYALCSYICEKKTTLTAIIRRKKKEERRKRKKKEG